MSRTEKQMRLDASPNAGLVLDQWLEGLSQILESMTGRKPQVDRKAVSGPASEVGIALDADMMLWWEQPFSFAPEMTVWVGAPQDTWSQSGTMTLRAAGLDTVSETEARNTWLEILGQSLASMARSIASLLQREVTLEDGLERPPSADIIEWATVALSMRDVALAPLVVALSPKLTAIVAAPPLNPPAKPDAPSLDTDFVPAGYREPSRTLDLLMDVDLPVSISFGRAQLPLKEVMKLTTGSIVELNRGVSEPVEILIHQRLIARGEVVVVEGNYGVRVLEILSAQERLGSLS